MYTLTGEKIEFNLTGEEIKEKEAEFIKTLNERLNIKIIEERRKNLVGIVIVAIICLVGFIIFIANLPTTPPPTSPTPPTVSLSIGNEGLLKVSDDPNQVVFLATDPDASDELLKVILAKDEYDLLELGLQGRVFGVTNGTKVKIIDTAFAKRKVRIIQGIKPVDADKVGRSGWVPMEFVVPTQQETTQTPQQKIQKQPEAPKPKTEVQPKSQIQSETYGSVVNKIEGYNLSNKGKSVLSRK